MSSILYGLNTTHRGIIRILYILYLEVHTYEYMNICIYCIGTSVLSYIAVIPHSILGQVCFTANETVGKCRFYNMLSRLSLPNWKTS